MFIIPCLAEAHIFGGIGKMGGGVPGRLVNIWHRRLPDPNQDLYWFHLPLLFCGNFLLSFLQGWGEEGGACAEQHARGQMPASKEGSTEVYKHLQQILLKLPSTASQEQADARRLWATTTTREIQPAPSLKHLQPSTQSAKYPKLSETWG